MGKQGILEGIFFGTHKARRHTGQPNSHQQPAQRRRRTPRQQFTPPTPHTDCFPRSPDSHCELHAELATIQAVRRSLIPSASTTDETPPQGAEIWTDHKLATLPSAT